jgi:hypothetical protein
MVRAGIREEEGEGGEMTQTMYAHMNKIKIKKNRYSLIFVTHSYPTMP